MNIWTANSANWDSDVVVRKKSGTWNSLGGVLYSLSLVPATQTPSYKQRVKFRRCSLLELHQKLFYRLLIFLTSVTLLDSPFLSA